MRGRRHASPAYQDCFKISRAKSRVISVRPTRKALIQTRTRANFAMLGDTLMPAAPNVQPAKRESTVLLLVKIVKYALRVSTVKVERQMPRPAQIARLAFTKKMRDKHRASHAFQERSTINSENVLVILAHLDFLPTRRSIFNATRVR